MTSDILLLVVSYSSQCRIRKAQAQLGPKGLSSVIHICEASKPNLIIISDLRTDRSENMGLTSKPRTEMKMLWVGPVPSGRMATTLLLIYLLLYCSTTCHQEPARPIVLFHA